MIVPKNESAVVKRTEAAIAAEDKAAKKQLAVIESYANGMPKESVTYDNVAAAAKSYLGEVADKLSGQYGYLANVSYAT
jgi:ribosomal protein S20